MRSIVLIAHNIRSAHNVGAILRTADGFAISEVIFSGYTPYPAVSNDTRLPHIREKLTSAISKTSLGAENTVQYRYVEQPIDAIVTLRKSGYAIVALEQTAESHLLPQYLPPAKIALILGEEVQGVPSELLSACDECIEIPMYGQKESFNVSVATGITLYHLRTT